VNAMKTITTTILSLGLAASAACTVTVNGKTHRLGGGGDTASASTSTSDGAQAAQLTGNAGSAPVPDAMPGVEPIAIDGTFVGPLVSKLVSVKFGDVRVYDAGYRQCDQGGGAFTTTQAPFQFELKQDLPELRLRLEGPNGYSAGVGGVIIKPDGSYVCDDDHSEVYGKDWPKGTYKVLLYASSIGGTAALRFDVPSKVNSSIESIEAALPTIAIGVEGAINPVWVSLAPTRSAEAADIGMGCDKGAHDRVMPLAKIDVKRASTWQLYVPDQDLFLVTPDQHCVGLGTQQLSAGVHMLWASVGSDGAVPAAYELEADDRDRPMAFADAEKKPVGALAEAMTIAGTVRASERQPARGYTCTGPRQPDFYLTSDQPLQHVELSLLWGRAPQQVHVFGPLESAEKNNTVRCGSSGENARHEFDVFEGTYAVWIGGDETTATGSAYHVLLRRTDVAVEPLTALAPIPKDLTMEERALKNHYPFFAGRELSDWSAAFTRAPDQLFIYTRTEAKDDDGTIPAGEPLLVAWSNRDTTVVYRFDGGSARVDTRLLTTDKPATVNLPTRFVPPVYDTPSQAMDHSGPEDDKAIAAYTKIDERYTACLGNYLAKNDPTWGHSGDLYKISGSGKVTNVSDEIGDRGAKKCGVGKLDAAGNKLVKTLAKTRAARYAAHLKAVRARFGL